VLTITPTAVRIAVRVAPRSARDRVVGPHGGSLKLQVTAPPVEGAANRAVIDLLAGWLGVPRRAFTIVQGQAGRNKVVEVASDDPEVLARRIAALAGCVDFAGGAD
jgi:uncharacterized protein (TIGR00251 family)